MWRCCAGRHAGHLVGAAASVRAHASPPSRPRTWHTFLDLATSWHTMVFLYLWWLGRGGVEPVMAGGHLARMHAHAHTHTRTRNARRSPGVAPRPPPEHGVGPARDVAGAAVLNLRGGGRGGGLFTCVRTCPCVRACITHAWDSLLGNQSLLTLCIRTKGLGPRHVSHTMGMSLRSHPSCSGSRSSRCAISGFGWHLRRALLSKA